MLNGKSLNIINPIGGLVAGQPKSYDLWVTGDIISITESHDVERLDNAINEALKLKKHVTDLNINNYIEYLINNGLFEQ